MRVRLVVVLAVLLAALGALLGLHSSGVGGSPAGRLTPAEDLVGSAHALEEPQAGLPSPARTALPPRRDLTGDPREARAAEGRDGGVRVRVVDADGAPLDGVPLELFREGRRAPDSYFMSIHATDLSGEVLFERARFGASTWVGIALPLDEPVAAPAKEGTVVELVAPPLGVLDFTLLDVHGNALENTRGHLSIQGSGGTSDGEWNGVLMFVPEAYPCRLRLPFHLAYSFWIAMREWRHVDGGSWPELSPAASERTHAVVVIDRVPVLVGRLLLPDGRPFVGLGKLVWSGGSGEPVPGLVCDENGAFRVPVATPSGSTNPDIGFLASSRTGFLDLECVVQLARSLPDADVPLGDLRLHGRPVLVAGRTQGAPMGRRGSPSLHVYERLPGDDAWTEAAYDSNIQRDSGAFVVFGEPRIGATYCLCLVTSKVRQISSGLFEPGQLDFVIELGAPAVLHSTLHADEGFLARDLKLQLNYGESFLSAPDQNPLRKFRKVLEPLHPGRVDIEIQHASGAVLGHRDGVELRSGEVTEIELDLRGLLDVRVSVLQSRQDSRPDVRVLFREGDSGPYGWLAVQSGLNHRILSIAPKVDVVVLARWHAPKWFDDLDADVNCHLELGPSVTVLDPRRACAYEGGCSLSAVFHPRDARLAALTPTRWLSAYPRNDNVATGLPAPGDYSVEWIARSGRGVRRKLEVEPLEVTIRDGYQRIELPLPLEAWQRFKEELDR